MAAEKKVRVRMKTSIAGHAMPQYELEDFAFNPLQVVELHPELAAAWLNAGHCEPMSKSAPETATKPAAQTRKTAE